MSKLNGGSFSPGLDSSFIEPWAKRPKAYPKERKRTTRHGAIIDAAFRRRLREMWLRGVSKKKIAVDLKCCLETVRKVALEENMPSRQPARGLTGVEHEITFRVDAALWARIEKRCHIGGMRRAKYIRFLIARDLENNRM